MKRKILILTLGLMMVVSAKAQIFVMEDEANNRTVTADPSYWPDVPSNENQGHDDYVPVGSGIALLAVLGGAYFIGKRKEEANQ
jgi:hypothetical protein